MASLFGGGGNRGGGDNGSGAIRAENAKQSARLDQEAQDLRVTEGKREAAARKVRIGGGGQRRLLSAKGFAGVDKKTKLGQ